MIQGEDYQRCQIVYDKLLSLADETISINDSIGPDIMTELNGGTEYSSSLVLNTEGILWSGNIQL